MLHQVAKQISAIESQNTAQNCVFFALQLDFEVNVHYISLNQNLICLRIIPFILAVAIYWM